MNIKNPDTATAPPGQRLIVVRNIEEADDAAALVAAAASLNSARSAVDDSALRINIGDPGEAVLLCESAAASGPESSSSAASKTKKSGVKLRDLIAKFQTSTSRQKASTGDPMCWFEEPAKGAQTPKHTLSSPKGGASTSSKATSAP